MSKKSSEFNKIKSIMIIDDNEINIFLVKRFIEAYDASIEVVTFNSAVKAIEYFNYVNDEEGNILTLVPNVILLDINMPGMDGFQFLDTFDKFKTFNPKSVKIIFISSTIIKEELEQVKNYGERCTFIPRPITPPILWEHLNNYN